MSIELDKARDHLQSAAAIVAKAAQPIFNDDGAGSWVAINLAEALCHINRAVHNVSRPELPDPRPAAFINCMES